MTPDQAFRPAVAHYFAGGHNFLFFLYTDECRV